MARWTYRQSWFCLVGSTALTLAISFGGYGLLHRWQEKRLQDPHNQVVAIVQTGPEKEALKTAYLAELLELSADQPTSLYAIHAKEAEKKLLACPLIAKAKVQRVSPGTLYIDYTIRKPIAQILDYQNIGIDRDGYLFPLSPFYSPKNLPEVYLGLPPFGSMADASGRSGGLWQSPLKDKYFSLAIDLLHILADAPWRENLRIKRIDVSNAFAKSAGQREIVLMLDDELTVRDAAHETVCVFPKILRLPAKNYAQQLGNFLSLRKSMHEDYRRQIAQAHYSQPSMTFASRIIDLRIPQTAYVQNN
jgi:hypothetical protein